MRLLETIAHLFHPRRSNNHRARVLHAQAYPVLALVLFAFVGGLFGVSHISSPMGQVLGYASSITPVQVLELTNQRRSAAGLASLSLNSRLSEAALAKGQHMLLEQYWAHTAPDGTQPWKFFKDAGYSYRIAGENLARDFSTSEDMMTAWIASPTHRANIMNDRYQEIGIAVIDGSLEGYETTLVVQLFGTPASAGGGEIGAGGRAVTPELASESESTPVEETLIQVEPEPPADETQVLEPNNELTATPSVLASALVPQGSITVPPLFSPLQITKAFFLAMIMMIMGTLIYDSVVIGHRSMHRMVGHNLGHVLLFAVVAFILVSFKGGILG
jgi:hypothetical protein